MPLTLTYTIQNTQYLTRKIMYISRVEKTNEVTIRLFSSFYKHPLKIV